MAWELLAIWVIVIAAVTWFIRDEKRLRAEAEVKRAARYYAHAPKYRHVSTGTDAPEPARRVGGLSAQQRLFLLALAAPKDLSERPGSP